MTSAFQVTFPVGVACQVKSSSFHFWLNQEPKRKWDILDNKTEVKRKGLTLRLSSVSLYRPLWSWGSYCPGLLGALLAQPLLSLSLCTSNKSRCPAPWLWLWVGWTLYLQHLTQLLLWFCNVDYKQPPHTQKHTLVKKVGKRSWKVIGKGEHLHFRKMLRNKVNESLIFKFMFKNIKKLMQTIKV